MSDPIQTNDSNAVDTINTWAWVLVILIVFTTCSDGGRDKNAARKLDDLEEEIINLQNKVSSMEKTIKDMSKDL